MRRLLPVGGGGLGGLVFGKENFLPVGPQGALIAVPLVCRTPVAGEDSAWCVCRGPPTTSAGLF